jgi:hypothetical protein
MVKTTRLVALASAWGPSGSGLVGADGGWGKPCGPDNAGLTNRFRRSRPTLSELPGGGLCQQTTLLAACKLWPLHARRLMSWHTV